MENEQAQSRSVTPFKTSAELTAEARVLFEEVAPAVHAACSAIYEDGDHASLDEERVARAAETVGRLSATLAPYPSGRRSNSTPRAADQGRPCIVGG